MVRVRVRVRVGVGGRAGVGVGLRVCVRVIGSRVWWAAWRRGVIRPRSPLQ